MKVIHVALLSVQAGTHMEQLFCYKLLRCFRKSCRLFLVSQTIACCGKVYGYPGL